MPARRRHVAMSRCSVAGPVLTAGLLAAAIGLSACGSSGTPSAGSTGAAAPVTSTGGTSSGGPGTPAIAHAALTVAPATGDQYTEFRFGFTAPDASGRQGVTASSYTLSVSGPPGSGCTAVESMALSAVTKGQQVSVPIGPGAHDRWCAGTYSARVDETARPICTGGQMCPQFIRILAVAGPVTFQVK